MGNGEKFAMMLMSATRSKECEGFDTCMAFGAAEIKVKSILEFKYLGYEVLHEISAWHLALWRVSKMKVAHICGRMGPGASRALLSV